MVCKRMGVVFFSVTMAIFFSGCGYHNPNLRVDNTPSATLQVAMWENHTNELGLEAIFYQSISDWFSKSRGLVLVDDPGKAEYVLSGSIVSSSSPALAYGLYERAKELRAILTMDITLTHTKKVVWKQSRTIEEEPYKVEEDAVNTLRNKQRAFLRISDKVAERLYFQTCTSIVELEKNQSSDPTGR